MINNHRNDNSHSTEQSRLFSTIQRNSKVMRARETMVLRQLNTQYMNMTIGRINIECAHTRR